MRKRTKSIGALLPCVGAALILTLPAAPQGGQQKSETASALLAEAAYISAELTLTGLGGVVTDEAVGGSTVEQTRQIKSGDAPVEAVLSSAPTLSETYSYDSIMLSHGDNTIVMQSDDEQAVLIGSELSSDGGDAPYPTDIEENDGAIMMVSYTKMSGSEYIELEGGGQVRNVTALPNDRLLSESKKLPEFKIKTDGTPQVLIMHTHTTESYEPYARNFYDDSFISRTTDQSKSVVAVGRRAALKLQEAGIGVVHDTTVHDYPSFNGSYSRSAKTVLSCLEEYPDIKVVIDIHRDAIERSDGSRIAPIAEINGRSAAQVMIISGCDDGTMNMPDYMQNFRLAALLQRQLEEDCEGITRPVLFDYRKYNQDLTTGSLLVEVGGHSNSLEQALYTGDLLGEALADALLGIAEG